MSDVTVTMRLVGQGQQLGAVLDATTARVNRLQAATTAAGGAGVVAGRTSAAGMQGYATAATLAAQRVALLQTAAVRAGAANEAAMVSATRRAKEFNSTLVSTRSNIAAVIGVSLGIAALRQINNLADGYTNINSKIRIVTQSESDLNRVREKTLAIAQETRSSFDSTVTLYTRIARATENMSMTEKENLAITSTVNKAYSIAGATFQEASNSIIQLTQGLQSGTLRGEEFNSVAEQAPLILELLGKTLNKTRGQLRLFAMDGGLTAEVVTKALLDGQAKIDKEFERVAVTVEGGATRVTNAWQNWIGQVSAARGVSAGLASALTALAANMDTFATGLVAIGGLIAVRFGASLITGIRNYIVQQQEATAIARVAATAQAELLAAESAVTAAKVASRAATVATNAAALQRIAVLRTEIELQLLDAKASQNAGYAALDHAQKQGAANVIKGLSAKATAQIVAAKEAEILATQKLNTLLALESAARGKVAAATEAQAAATAGAVAQTTLLQKSAGVAGSVVSGLGTGALLLGRGLLALVGGPIGAAIIAIGYLVLQFRSAMNAGADYTRSLETINKSLKSTTELTEDYYQLMRDNSADAPAFGKALERVTANADLFAETQKKLAEAQDQLNSQNGIWLNMLSSLSPEVAAFAARYMPQMAEETEKTKQMMAELQQQTFNLSGELIDSFVPAANAALAKLAELGQQRSAGGIFATVSAAIDTFQKGVKDVEKNSQAASRGMTDLSRAVSQQREEMQTAGLSAHELAVRFAEQKVAAAELAGKHGEVLEKVKAEAAEYVKNADILDKNKKKVKEHTETYKSFENGLNSVYDALNRLDDMLSRAQEGTNPLINLNLRYKKSILDVNQQTEDAIRIIKEHKKELGSVAKQTDLINQARQTEKEILEGLAKQNADDVKVVEDQIDWRGKLERSYADLADVTALYGDAARVEAAVQAEVNAQHRELLLMAPDERAKRLEAIRDTVTFREENQILGEAAAATAAKVRDIVSSFDDISGFKQLILNIRDVGKELKDAIKLGTDPEGIKRLQVAYDGLNAQLKVKTLGSFKALIGVAQTFTKEGSKGFLAMEVGMAAISIVQDIIAMKAAVIGVLTQMQGEPYSAFARMAAAAAAAAPFLASIGLSLSSVAGGGVKDNAAANQAIQGTGSVLGDSKAQSESIVNAVEITANASKQLVAINRGMLVALQALQSGLSGASTQIAQGGSPDFGAIGGVPVNSFVSGFGVFGGSVGQVLAKLSGASKKVTDEGIRILGGAMATMLQGVSVSAYQQISSKSWFLGSTHTNTKFQSLGDGIAKQFQLILNSIADTVREGAKALGLDMDAVNAAIAAYRIEEIKISTKGLSGEETQKALEAVFSKIFDGLAGAVVPFIGQFQKVGEGLGETLVRVATSVQVMQEAVKQLGFSLDVTDPERFAQASVALIELAGGVDQFITDMGTFVGAFATEAHKFDVAQTALNSAFAEVGLTVPETRDGMWELMESLDATTESGRAQIATLLRLAGVADEYYNMLTKRQDEINNILDGNAASLDTTTQSAVEQINKRFEEMRVKLEKLGASLKEFAMLEDQRIATLQKSYDALRKTWDLPLDTTTLEGAQTAIALWEAEQIRLANEYAIALGETGASAEDIAKIHLNAAYQTAQAIKKFKDAYDSFINGFRPNATLPDGTGATSVGDARQQATVWGNRQIAIANELAIAAGMAGASAEDIALIWARVHENVAAAQARLLADYQTFVDQFKPVTELPTGENGQNLEQARAQAAAWEAEQIRRANELAVAAGLYGAAEENLLNIHNRAAEFVAAAIKRINSAIDDYNEFIQNIRRESGEFTEYQLAMQDAESWRAKAIADANRLAIAAGLTGARVEDLAAITKRFGQLAAIALNTLKSNMASVAAQLGYGGVTGSLDALNARIQELESGAGSVGQAGEDMLQKWLDGIKAISAYLDSLLLNPNLTTLTPEQQLAEARRQYEAALAAAQGGDATALAALPGLANTYLELARGFFSSGDQYQAIFDSIIEAMHNLMALQNPGGGTDPVLYGPTPELVALYEERDRMMAEQEAAHRLELANQLAVYLRDLAAATGQSVFELASSLGYDIQQFIRDLGINVDNVTVETVRQLAALATTLGVSIGDLAQSVGFDLGTLADRQSLLNQAIDQTIGELPDGTGDALRPYLDAIRDATNDADANAAILRLTDFVNTQPDAIRAALAPYFQGIIPPETFTQLDYLTNIDVSTARAADEAAVQTGWLVSIDASNAALYTEAMATNVHLARLVELFESGAGSGASTSGYPSAGGSGGAASNNIANALDAIANNPNLSAPDNTQAAQSMNALVAEVQALRAEVAANGILVANAVETGAATGAKATNALTNVVDKKSTTSQMRGLQRG